MTLSETFCRKYALKLAIVGRPNVGKSTLFNRLCGKRMAIVHDLPGVTRDRKEAFGQLGDIPLKLIDTAGLEEQSSDPLMAGMKAQVMIALQEADVLLFMIDGRQGVTSLDEVFANLLRRAEKPILLVANKCEGRDRNYGIAEAWSLGVGEPLPLSAEHGLGLDSLYEALVSFYKGPLGEEEEVAEETTPIQLAIVGRPNVGKSTLLNQLIGYERVLTGPEAGVTRDTIATDWEYQGQALRLIDTAGLRKRAKVTEKLEWLATSESRTAIQYAQVVVVVIDATQPLEKQDLHIASQVIEEGRCLVLALNKWDLIPNKQDLLNHLHERLTTALPQVKGVPLVPLSALTGKNKEKLLDAILAIYKTWNQRISTSKLNRWLEGLVAHHPPPLVAGRRIKIKYLTQIKTRPPTFVLFCSKSTELPDSYERYVINGIREAFSLQGVPIRLFLRSGKNPYASV
ncbi:MAG: ribosome biogenesis GTPase Der [Alphaproteobacteria bacterium]|nr:ribosome biogenesis GTPase Der [Alphaproteobacteria bacterium]MBP7729184.1 ribosome biogenesis GTPase Der [Alphaproteobacteria bacterium]